MPSWWLQPSCIEILCQKCALKHTFPRIPACMWPQNYISNHSCDYLRWVLQTWSTPSTEIVLPISLPAVAIRTFLAAFSITGNQKCDYYDSIQCALMVGGNLLLNHAIAVINLLSALVPVPCSNLLPKRQRARLENREKKQMKREERGSDCRMCVWWFRSQPPFAEASEWVGVFFPHNIVLKQIGKKEHLINKMGSHH